MDSYIFLHASGMLHSLAVVFVQYLFLSSTEQIYIYLPTASQVALVVKNPPTNSGDIRETGLIPE